MKIIITENQFDYVNSLNKAERLFYKYWDKNGPNADDTLFRMFGFTPMGMEFNGTIVKKSDVYRFLRNWYGDNKAALVSEKILSQKHFTINSCGGYNFDFEVVSFYIEDELGTIYVTIKPDLKNGEVELIMVGGEIENLQDAIDNDNYGWEIETEITDCVYDYLTNKITNTTGYEIAVEDLIR